jgi:hypothetical protein
LGKSDVKGSGSKVAKEWSMNANKILVAVDDSEASSRAVAYVAALIGGKKGFSVRLFHVLAPLSPELLEFVGSENTDVEERMEAEERAAQTRWIEAAEKAAQPVFTQAESILHKAGVWRPSSPHRSATKTWSPTFWRRYGKPVRDHRCWARVVF